MSLTLLFNQTTGGGPTYYGTLMRWDGGAWVKALLKYWDGGAWQPATLRLYVAGEWKLIDTTGV